MLNGFMIRQVTRQIVNGLFYEIEYFNQEGATLLYRVFVSRDGETEVQSVHSTAAPLIIEGGE